MDQPEIFSPEDAARATTALRAALGLSPERFGRKANAREQARYIRRLGHADR